MRVGTCRFADDPTAYIEFDANGERITPCPLKFEECDKQLEPYVAKKSSPVALYAAAAAGVLVLVLALFFLTGEPSETQRREAAAKELKEIWPWLHMP